MAFLAALIPLIESSKISVSDFLIFLKKLNASKKPSGLGLANSISSLHIIKLKKSIVCDFSSPLIIFLRDPEETIDNLKNSWHDLKNLLSHFLD